jgi:autotransporter translocation and assembly factor TamB
MAPRCGTYGSRLKAKGWRRVALLGIGILVLLGIGIFAFRGPLARAGIGIVGRLAGYDVRYDTLTNAGGRLSVTDVSARAIGRAPLFHADRIDVAYSLRHLFGGPYLYGISAVEIDRPELTVVRGKDGTYNFTLPASSGSPSKGPPPIPKIRLVIRDGAAGLTDETRIFAHSRKLALRDLQANAEVDPKSVSRIAVTFALAEDGGTFPIVTRGTLDEVHGYENTRITAGTVALAPLIDYALNSTSLHIAEGVLNDIDARIYGFRDRSGTMQRHVSASANLDHFQPYLNGIAKPLRDGRGSLRVYDDGLTIPKVDGSIAGIPVRIAGAIYDLQRPQLRLGIVGKGDLRALATLNDAAEKLPVSGPVSFALFVEGDATQPTTLASFTSPRIAYGTLPIDEPSGLVALHGADTTILRSALAYDGATAAARGNVNVLAKHTNVEIVANVDGRAERFPYAAELLGPMGLHADAVVAGVDERLAATGVVTGDGPSAHLSGSFSLAANGTGTIGPILLAGPGPRELYARVALDAPKGAGGAAFVSARDFAFTTAGPQPSLPGISLAALPHVSGTIDGDAAGTFAGKRFTLGGNAHARGLRAFGYPIDDVTARAATVDGTHVAVDARYRGALAPLAHAAGGTIAASGSADIPIAVVANGANDVLVQIHDARFDRALVAGVALGGLSATARVRGGIVDVYGAQATLDGHAVVANGRFGGGGTLEVSASDIDLATLRAAGLPVRSGDVSAVASLSGTAASPHVEGDLAVSDLRLADPRAASLPIDASSLVAYDAGRLDVRDAVVRAGPAVGTIDGDVAGLRRNPKAARYAFRAHVRQADIATLARIARADALYPEGTLDADVDVTGSGTSPRLTGDIAVPEGSVNGLNFRDASVALSGGIAAVAAERGHVTVGSTALGFDAAVSANEQTAHLRAPRIDLADFNDFFDYGDTLGGKGSVALYARNEPNRIVTNGRIRIADTHLRRFVLGATKADWSTKGRTVDMDVAIGGTTGRVTENGDVLLPSTQPLRDALHRTKVNLSTRATGVDLATWLPAANVQAPITGFVDATAIVHGAYPNIAVIARAGVRDGMAGRVPIRTATLDARAANGEATITEAVLAIDNARATATGSVSLDPRAPFELTIVAGTKDIGALAKTVTGTTYDVSGTVDTTAYVVGTFDHPAIADTIDAESIRYGAYTVPRVTARLAISRTRAQLTSGEIDFAKGRVVASGFAPLDGMPPTIGPPSEQLSLDLEAEHVDFAQFAPLLPKGTALGGFLDGGASLVGTIAQPGLRGTLAVSNGSFVGPQLTSKISDLAAQVTFQNRTATLHDASANVGGGTVTASGSLSVPNLQSPARSAAGSLALTSTFAVFDLPSLFKGRVNGNVTISRAARRNAIVAGSLDVTSARIPTTALIPKTTTAASDAKPLPVSLALAINVGNDVRVQGGPVDIGAKGDLTVGGTIAAPTVMGELESTGGTISLYRTFALQYPSTVTFDGSGVIPNVDASATTTVDNPPTDVTLRVTGPATALNVVFDSNPSYSQQQILGILVGAQALGAVSGLPTTPGSQSAQNPFQSLAEGQLGTLLTQNILEPFSSQLGSAIGLSNLSINYSPFGGASVGAQKRIFKNVSAVFAESFNYPQRQSIGLVASNDKRTTAAQLTFFSQPDANQFNVFEGAQTLNSSNNSVTASEPANGTSGFSFSLQRKF